jgi:hypothetical protein
MAKKKTTRKPRLRLYGYMIVCDLDNGTVPMASVEARNKDEADRKAMPVIKRSMKRRGIETYSVIRMATRATDLTRVFTA